MNLITVVLYLISFLDSVCFGLIMPVLPTHILILGGTHTILGLHGALHMSLQLFSGPLSRTCGERFGRKPTLKLTLLLGVITNGLMGLHSSYVLVIALRLIFYVTNQTQNLVRAFASDLEAKQGNQNGIASKLDLLGILGFVVGPIAGGYIFEQINGFLPEDPVPAKNKKQKSTTLKEKISDAVQVSTSAFRSIDKIKYRNILFLRLLVSFSLAVFFIKFSLLLKVHYLASHSLVGWTIAYQNVVMSLATVSVSFLETRVTVRDIYKLRRFLSVLAITATALCFAPAYEIYLLSFVPMAVAKSFVESAWPEIEKAQEKDAPRLGDVLRTVVTVANVFAPIVLGVLCDIYVQNAVKTLTVVPLVAASFLGSYYYVGSVRPSFDKKE